MHVKRCDGCHAELDVDDRMGARKHTCIEGKRVDGLPGSFGGLLARNGVEFHWCTACTRIAFKAVEDAATSRG